MMAIEHQPSMNSQQQIYCITGAAGFIGSYICQILLKKHNDALIIGIDNINEYYSPAIKKNRISRLSAFDNFVFYEETILNTEALRRISARHKPSILIHTAAEVGVRSGESDPLRYFSTNVMGTLSVLEANKEYLSHAVMFSSSSVYGNCSTLPFSEYEIINMKTPISTYGASKTSMEIAVKNFYNRTHIPTTIIRPFSVYGPDGRPDMLPIKLLLCAKKNIPLDVYDPTTLTRDWTYIDDFIRMFMPIIAKSKKFQILNIGSGSPLRLDKVLHIAKEVIQTHGLTLQYSVKKNTSIEMVQTWADNAKALAFAKPFVFTSFKEGFNHTAEFFFSHLDLYSL